MWSWATAVDIDIPGGPILFGNELRIIAKGGVASAVSSSASLSVQGPLDFLQTFTILAADIPLITLTDETLGVVPDPLEAAVNPWAPDPVGDRLNRAGAFTMPGSAGG